MFSLIALYFSYRRNALFPTVPTAAAPARVATPAPAAVRETEYKLAA